MYLSYWKVKVLNKQCFNDAASGADSNDLVYGGQLNPKHLRHPVLIQIQTWSIVWSKNETNIKINFKIVIIVFVVNTCRKYTGIEKRKK